MLMFPYNLIESLRILLIYIIFLYCKAWNVVVNTSDNINYQLISTAVNGVQTVGTILNSVGFGATYPLTSAVPNLSAIQFNGISLCSNGILKN